mgnify:CR=1 FL=1
MTHIYLTEEQWEQQFVSLETHYDVPDNVPAEYMWTLLDSNDGGLAYANGIHWVNAVSYCQCEKPWTSGVDYTVDIDTEGLDP